MRRMHLPLALTTVLALGALGLEKAQASPGSAEIARSFTLPVEVTRSDAALGKPVLVGTTLTMGAVAGLPRGAGWSVAPSAAAQPESLSALIRELRARLLGEPGA